MIQFGRVEGFLEESSTGNNRYRLRVVLETSRDWRVVRDEEIALSASPADRRDLTWQVDQYTQETIGVDLAEEGWEVIGGGELPTDEPAAVIRSATYAVRRL